MKKFILSVVILFVMFVTAIGLSSCDSPTANSVTDKQAQKALANTLQGNQPTPTDIEYSLERYNLIRRAYWVNGQRDKAIQLPCPVEKPLGYIYLISMGTVIGQFTVDGKVTSLAKYLTPDYEYSGYEMADTDGCYGNETDGIFFFTPDGKYIQWSGDYIYSDIPFNVKDTVLE